MKSMKKVMSLLLTVVMVMAMAVSTAAFAATAKPTLSETSLTMNAGEKMPLTVKNNTKNATVTWSSSNINVAAVTKSGVVRAKAPGNATITAKVGSDKLTCSVKVNQALRRSDFEFKNGTYTNNGTRPGVSNYIDITLKDPSFTETKQGTRNGYSNDIRSYENFNLKARGVGLGSTKTRVLLTFGKEETDEVTKADRFSGRFYSYDQPIEKVTYTYYENNHIYYQSYYFNDSDKVCMVAWYQAEAD